jgi:hypothetical protein
MSGRTREWSGVGVRGAISGAFRAAAKLETRPGRRQAVLEREMHRNGNAPFMVQPLDGTIMAIR